MTLASLKVYGHPIESGKTQNTVKMKPTVAKTPGEWRGCVQASFAACILWARGKLWPETRLQGSQQNLPHFNEIILLFIKRLPATWEIWVQSLRREDSPGEGNGNQPQHSCLENPVNRGAWGRLQSIGCKKSDTTEVTEHAHMHKTLSLILNSIISRSEERRVGKECRSRWSPYH